ncbi:2'-5' RNA ligase family protein [Streptomyces sp. CG 926]|uniref:2'-5' RNA ligase family protein n=1 Tax=Streptomyces sp. CG 926 TaxID=1882405 RepID=UPI001C637BFB|nr:2'-5' RNA ligase family protein [Streptomyces sp. CG 926]
MAVDVLLNPDESMIALAKQVNARMLTSVPAPTGFALDEHHQPHITALQRYVRTAALDQVYAAIDDVVASLDLSTLKLTTHRIAHMEVQPSIGLAAIVVTPGPEVIDFQARLIDALRPYTGSGGTADAYVRTDAEPDINAATLTYIENYVPDHSGENYLPHVTVGLATLSDLKTVEAEPPAPQAFSVSGVSIYQLGNNGTAAKPLRSWGM